jgi:hypothetical protein
MKRSRDGAYLLSRGRGGEVVGLELDGGEAGLAGW